MQQQSILLKSSLSNISRVLSVMTQNVRDYHANCKHGIHIAGHWGQYIAMEGVDPFFPFSGQKKLNA
jgi:hypothetical protein